MKNVAGTVMMDGGDISISDIAYHAAAVKPGGCFVAIRGGSADGHAFVREAIERGAAAIVTERSVELPSGVANIVVPDARRALAQLSANFFCDPSLSLRLIGITGTNGKTSTSFLLESILQHAGVSCGVIGTIEHRFAGRRLAAEH